MAGSLAQPRGRQGPFTCGDSEWEVRTCASQICHFVDGSRVPGRPSQHWEAGGVPKPLYGPDGSRAGYPLLPPQIFWVGPLTGAVLASLIYNFILFPDTKTLAQRLAILTGTAEVQEVEGVEPQKEESQSSSEDTEMENVCQVA